MPCPTHTQRPRGAHCSSPTQSLAPATIPGATGRKHETWDWRLQDQGLRGRAVSPSKESQAGCALTQSASQPLPRLCYPHWAPEAMSLGHFH